MIQSHYEAWKRGALVAGLFRRRRHARILQVDDGQQRSAAQPDPTRPTLIRNERGVGYRLIVPEGGGAREAGALMLLWLVFAVHKLLE